MNLISKYNTAAPRYTSYPTVPCWEDSPTENQWKGMVKRSFDESNAAEGISLYIHLPYCESLCTYCGCNTRITVNHAVEKPYVDALLKEWMMYKEVLKEIPIIREIHLGGGTPTFFASEELARLINGIMEGAQKHPEHIFSFEGHPGNTTEQHLKTLFDLGFTRVSFGIQDFDEQVQDVINRTQTVEEVEKVVNKARQIGYTSVNFDLVYGLPLQTTASVKNTIQEVLRLKPERIAFYSYAHVPWIKPGQRKFTELDLPQDVVKRSLYEIGREAFLSNQYREIGMDHFALAHDALCVAEDRGQLHRNFMGYTSGHTQLMIGLGVSSIGDAWYGFAQNVKKVEDYLQCVNQGRLPIFRGHCLSEEDIDLRTHILNVMCKGRTRWTPTDFALERPERILSLLKEPLADSLVLASPEGLSVTEKGRAFLRNICTAFDFRMQLKSSDQQVFSNTV